MPNSKVTVLISPTKSCNLRCTYCYLSGTVKEDKTIMTISLFKAITEKIINEKNCKELIIIWHGGEPLLVGLDFYKKVVSIEKELEEKQNLKITNRIQTNGTLITPEFVEFFKENKFSWGISLDGPEYLNNKNRYDINKVGSFSKTLAGINNIKNRNGSFAALCIITKDHCNKAEELYSFFKELEPSSVKFNEFFIADKSFIELNKLAISNSEYNKFLIDIFNIYISDDSKLSVSPIDEIIRAIIHGKSKLCSYSKNCAGNFLSINPNGDVFYCNRLTEPNFLLGNLTQVKFEDLIISAKKKIKKEEISADCLHCEYKTICGGGCPAIYYFLHGNTKNRKDPFCLYDTFKYIDNYLKNLEIPRKI